MSEFFTPAEVAAYYASRVPAVRQTNARRWRGPCPVHNGENPSFSVDAATGLWHCFSGCSRGGDIIALEIELSGADFRTAKASVYDLTGRPPERVLSHQERRGAAFRHHQAKADAERAIAWRSGVLRDAERLLATLKAESLNPDVGEEDIGDTIGAIHRLAERVRGLRGNALMIGFRRQLAHDPRGTERTIAESRADTAHAEQIAAECVRLLERAALRDRAAA